MESHPFQAAPPLALSLAGLKIEGGPRHQLQWASDHGFAGAAVQIDAAAPGLRPREFDRSARRDLGALLRRLELAFAGLDLFIPPEHFTRPETLDRAMSAARAALEFAADLATLAGGVSGGASGGRPAVSMALPTEGAEEAIGELEARAYHCGGAIADLTWPASDANPDPAAAIGLGLDPASVLLAGDDPVRAVGEFGHRLRSARLCDLSSAGRTPPGEGRLDVGAYFAALSAVGHQGALVVDVRGLADQERVIETIVKRWGRRIGD
ncbi:MAG: sugar phosphate isomerase/epimerase [Phycisphaeraceae bacterium]|nr:MAG: sugar phosphate isomerase/epimerase [Phycisphaeraceae bacterium]